ncbi:MAG: hypothetical protein M1818_007448 [Claussenomyces sp. TS43310]|nr:MAG: hypothetical protein M1818_007448 [Claussenomyces sp. TS43310]
MVRPPSVSALLAGMKRSTGLTYASLSHLASHAGTAPPLVNPTLAANEYRPSLKSETITENKEVSKWVNKYLDVGEWVMDQSVAIAGASGYFKRER